VIRQKGQTLLEILLAFSVSIVVLSTLIFGIIVSLSNTQYTKNQNLANSYAQEGMAVVRQIRDSGGNLKDSYTTNTAYCLGQDTMELKELTLPDQNCWAQSPVGGIFSREVKFEHESSSCCNTQTCADNIRGSKGTLKVSWSSNKCPVDAPLCHDVELITCFSNTDQKQEP
jgi:Tfp pilus assembly protein PilV